MKKIALIHICTGFWLVFFAAAFGAFIGLQVESSFFHGKDELLSWSFLLLKSAHTHTNMFGFLHILMGLTLAHCKMSLLLEKIIFWLILSGSFTMSILMVIRSFFLPNENLAILMLASGVFLSFSLIGILIHAYFLTRNLFL